MGTKLGHEGGPDRGRRGFSWDLSKSAAPVAAIGGRGLAEVVPRCSRRGRLSSRISETKPSLRKQPWGGLGHWGRTEAE